MKQLPPGQHLSPRFPRFGLRPYANRFPSHPDVIHLELSGDGLEQITLSSQWMSLPRVEQVSDFHCVTTWTVMDLRWQGVRFSEFFNQVVRAHCASPEQLSHVVLIAQDGYKTSLYLDDLMQPDVLLADSLDNAPLTLAHGAPLRLVAPAHYGYKSIKHLKKILFYKQPQKIKQGMLSFMDHPRARVLEEERTSRGPARLFRYLYRPLISSTTRLFAHHLTNHQLSELSTK